MQANQREAEPDLDRFGELQHAHSLESSAQGLILDVNMLLCLQPVILSGFYPGERATQDGRCPFCNESLR